MKPLTHRHQSLLGTAAPVPTRSTHGDGRRRFLDLLLAGAAAAALAEWADLGPGYVLASLSVLPTIAAFAALGLKHHLPHRAFGPADSITLARTGLTNLIAGLAVHAGTHPPLGGWLLVSAGLAALVLDGIDDWSARRARIASAFGARFDMEVDALLILTLSFLLYHSGKMGPWVLGIGLMRYAFVTVSARWRWLANPLPPSGRRCAVCALQILLLLASLSPLVSGAAAAVLCALAPAALLASFGADVAWLARNADRSARDGEKATRSACPVASTTAGSATRCR